MYIVPRRAHAHFTQEGRRRLALPGPHRARGYVFRRAGPLWKGAERRAGRCAREPESNARPEYPCAARERNEQTKLSIRFSRKKCRHRWPRKGRSNWHEWPEDRMKLTDGLITLAAPGKFLTAAKMLICLRLPSSLSLNTFPNALTRVELSRRISGEVEVWQHTNTCDHTNGSRFLSSVG